MRIQGVRLTNVRCHRAAAVQFGAGLTVVQGPNGTGKTTVLEAIALGLTGRTPRTYRVTDCITTGEDYLRVEVTLEGDVGGDHTPAAGLGVTTAAFALTRAGERKLTADGCALQSPERWAALTPILTFFPDDLRLIKGNPRRRREFIDELLGARSPQYASSVERYARALAQRNALLQRSDANEEHAPWEAILAAEGGAIVEARAQGLAQFAPLFARFCATLACRPEEGIRLVYRTNAAELRGDAYRAVLREQRAGDRRRTFTHTGPHRDDVRFFLGPVDVRESGSQGEQRTAQLALVLAWAEWSRDHEGRRPILLLDDVMSELDYARRRSLVSLLLSDGQSIITTTDLHHFEAEELESATVISLGG